MSFRKEQFLSPEFFLGPVSGNETEPKDVVTVLAKLQREMQTIRDLARVAPAREKALFLQMARLVEQCVREFDKHA